MNKKKYFKNIKFKSLLEILLIILLPLVLVINVECMHRGSLSEGLSWCVENKIELLFNYLIAFSILNLLLIFMRGNLYYIFSSMVIFITSTIAYISYVKNDLRGEPLTILHYRLLGEAKNIVSTFNSSYYWPIIILLIMWAAIFAILCLIKLNIKLMVRAIVSAASIIIFLLIFNTGINSLGKAGITIPADVSWNHTENGFLLAAIIDSKFLKVPEPDNYNRDTINEIYNRMIEKKETDIAKNVTVEQPNVIFIMSESYWDPIQASNLEINVDPISVLRELAEENVSGFIDVPGIGGGTANTEYEVLTGLTRRFIPNYSTPYNPYNSYIHRPIKSLANIFSEMGYSTSAIHTYHSWFYRRGDVYQQLGFDKFISLDNMLEEPKRTGVFAYDSEIYNLIAHELTSTVERDFIFAVTVQGHGPYNDLVFDEKQIKINNNFSDETKVTVENYLNLLNDIDNDLNMLIQFVDSFNEPTIVVYFGDHIPPLGNETFTEIGFDVYESQAKKVPIVMWSNYSKLKGNIELDSNMLGAYVLNEIGLSNDSFMQYLYSLYLSSPHITSKTDAQILKDFQLLQFDIMHGKQYIYEFIGKPMISKEYSVGYPLQLTNVIALDKENKYVIDIHGSGISWMSEVFINDLKINDVIRNEGERITAFLTKDQIKDNRKSLDIQVKTIDSRGKIVKESNVLAFKDIEELKEKSEEHVSNSWYNIKLDSEFNWELFDRKDGFTIVRADLALEEKSYFVSRDGYVLVDNDANYMDKANLTDIYENGYIYISISNTNLVQNEEVTPLDIKNYFKENQYILYLGR